MKWSNADHRYMAQAIQLARHGLYSTSPNPRVGCVIVNGSEVVGTGFHMKAGNEHAEIIALQQAGIKAQGSTCYVTLEPCIHTGKTPPCTPALIKSGVARVVAAMIDPNPRVNGKGLEQLNQTGIRAESGLLQKEAFALNAGFIKRMTRGMPHVRCKLACSIDGKIALANGNSKWISSEQSRLDVQRLRAESCAIMTGIGTILADDPLLTVRDFNTMGRQPLRVILDRQLRLPVTARLLDQSGIVVVFTQCTDVARQEALSAKGVKVVTIVSGSFLKESLGYLAEKFEINDVLVEAGPELSGALFSSGLVDELIVYQAPVLLGSKARSMLALPEYVELAESIRMTLTECRQIGSDLRFHYTLNQIG